MNLMVPRGFSLVCRPQEGGSGLWYWAVRRYRSVLAEGAAKTEKAAQKALGQAAGTVITSASKSSGERAALKSRLKGWVEKRPYVASHVLDQMAHGAVRKEILAAAGDEEVRLHRVDKKKGIALPLPTHHLSKPPEEVAAVIYDTCVTLGIVGKKAWKYGSDMLGMAFSAPNAESHIEEVAGSQRNQFPDAEDVEEGDGE